MAAAERGKSESLKESFKACGGDERMVSSDCTLRTSAENGAASRFLQQRHRSSLRGVSLSGGETHDERAQTRFFRGLATKMAHMEFVEIDGEVCGGIRQLSRGLSSSASLRFLSLRRVSLATGPLELLADGLRASRVVYLSLRGCGLRDGRVLASVMRAHGAKRDQAAWARTLRTSSGTMVPIDEDKLTLDLADNDLDDECVFEIADGLDDYVRGLHLAGNARISEAGALRLKERILTTKIAAIRLEGTGATPETREAIDEILAKRKSFAVLEAWARAPAYPLSVGTVRRLYDNQLVPDNLSRLIVDVLCVNGRIARVADLDRALLAARVDCAKIKQRRRVAHAARRALETSTVEARGVTLAKKRTALVTLVGNEKSVDAVVTSNKTLGELASCDEYYGAPTEDTCEKCDALHRIMRVKKWRSSDLLRHVATDRHGFEASDLSAWLLDEIRRHDPKHLVAAAPPPSTDHLRSTWLDLAAYTFDQELSTTTKAPPRLLLDACGLESALHAVKRLGRSSAQTARGILLTRRVCSSLDDPKAWFDSVTIETLADSLKSVLGNEADCAAASQRLVHFAGSEGLHRLVDMSHGQDADCALARVAHAHRVLGLDNLCANNKWTTTEVIRQAQSLSLRRRGGKISKNGEIDVGQLRDALAEWKIAADEPPDLTDQAAIARAALALSDPLPSPPPAPSSVSSHCSSSLSDDEDDDDDVMSCSAASQQPADRHVSLSEVLSFARHVATEDGKLVDATRIEEAVRAYRRGAASVAKLRRAARSLDALREELALHDLDLGRWLEAAGDIGQDLEVEDIHNGLKALLLSKGAPPARLVQAAVDALGLFDNDDPKMPIATRYARADARAQAVSSKDEILDEDLAEFLTSGDFRHARIARRLDKCMLERKWRVPDLILALQQFDDRGAASPRALCRAMVAWDLFQPTKNSAEKADFDRIVGPPPSPRDKKSLVLRRRRQKSSAIVKKKPTSLKPVLSSAVVRRKQDQLSRKKQRPPPKVCEDDLLVALERAVLSIADRISHIENRLCDV